MSYANSVRSVIRQGVWDHDTFSGILPMVSCPGFFCLSDMLRMTYCLISASYSQCLLQIK